jgi:hypothetical protein
VLEIYCLMHGQQLVVSDGLKIVDVYCKQRRCGWLFFSTLAKLVHLWRDNASDFDNIWRQQLHTEPCRRLIAKCIAGRWGSVIDTLKDLRSRGLVNVLRVFKHFLKSPGPAELEHDAPIADAEDS